MPLIVNRFLKRNVVVNVQFNEPVVEFDKCMNVFVLRNTFTRTHTQICPIHMQRKNNDPKRIENRKTLLRLYSWCGCRLFARVPQAIVRSHESYANWAVRFFNSFATKFIQKCDRSYHIHILYLAWNLRILRLNRPYIYQPGIRLAILPLHFIPFFVGASTHTHTFICSSRNIHVVSAETAKTSFLFISCHWFLFTGEIVCCRHRRSHPTRDYESIFSAPILITTSGSTPPYI